MTTRMKAVINAQYGPPNILQIVDIDKPTPGYNDVLIKIKSPRRIAMSKPDVKKTVW